MNDVATTGDTLYFVFMPHVFLPNINFCSFYEKNKWKVELFYWQRNRLIKISIIRGRNQTLRMTDDRCVPVNMSWPNAGEWPSLPL